MESPHFTLRGVQENIEAVLEEMERGQIPLIDLLIANQTLKAWIFAHNIRDRIRENGDVILALTEIESVIPTPLDAFWGLCSGFGVELSAEKRKNIIRHFLDH